MATQDCIVVTPAGARVISHRGQLYTIEPFNARYVLVYLPGSELPAMQAAYTDAAIRAAMDAIADDLGTDDDPTPPPALVSLPLRMDVRVSACSKETKMNDELIHDMTGWYWRRWTGSGPWGYLASRYYATREFAQREYDAGRVRFEEVDRLDRALSMTERQQQYLQQITGTDHPRDAHKAAMAQWLAAKESVA